ncbi:MAG: substrate-binding domain-containing protein, partial [Phycisphaerae bacterium]
NRHNRRHILLALDYYDEEINRGVAEYARRAGWILNDIIGHDGRIPSQWHGDGVIALLNHPKGRLAKFISRTKVPVVDMVDEVPDINCSRVLADNVTIGRTGAEHLLSIGLDHLAFFQLGDANVERERMDGFRHAVEIAGKHFYHLDFSQVARDLAQTLDPTPWLVEQISKLPRPLGVMAQYDRNAQYVIQAAELASMLVPHDVAVVGVDNDTISCELGLLPMTSVDRRRHDHGFEAAALLDRLISGEKPPQGAILIAPGPVVVRHSTNIFAVDDPHLVRAIRFISEHFREPLAVEDVVAASGTQRRRLYELFEQKLGRAIKSEILRCRLNEARRLLTTTHSKLFAVATKSGFRDEYHLSRVFKAETGLSPGQFRRNSGEARGRGFVKKAGNPTTGASSRGKPG